MVLFRNEPPSSKGNSDEGYIELTVDDNVYRRVPECHQGTVMTDWGIFLHSSEGTDPSRPSSRATRYIDGGCGNVLQAAVVHRFYWQIYTLIIRLKLEVGCSRFDNSLRDLPNI